MNRYARQIMMPEIGIEGQQRIAKTRILVIGVGGIGSPAALYLAMAGVGTIGLVDCDIVDMTNLNRQILYRESDIGKSKVKVAAEQIRSKGAHIAVNEYHLRLSSDNAREIIDNYDIVVDGTDNFESRYILSDVCAELNKPFIYGAIQGFEGQVAVLCHGKNARTYRDLFPTPAEQSPMQKAVIGPTAGIVGCLQANEVIKIICNAGDSLSNRLITIDLRTMQSFAIDI